EPDPAGGVRGYFVILIFSAPIAYGLFFETCIQVMEVIAKPDIQLFTIKPIMETAPVLIGTVNQCVADAVSGYFGVVFIISHFFSLISWILNMVFACGPVIHSILSIAF